MSVRTRREQTCAWCGRPVAATGTGRKRRYCRQSCRQRAYEQRSSTKGTSIPDDAVVLTAEEASAAADRAGLTTALDAGVGTRRNTEGSTGSPITDSATTAAGTRAEPSPTPVGRSAEPRPGRTEESRPEAAAVCPADRAPVTPVRADDDDAPDASTDADDPAEPSEASAEASGNPPTSEPTPRATANAPTRPT